MEHLFSTNISVNNENINYHVVFDHEKYVFLPQAETKSYPSFSFHLEHEQWQEKDTIPPDIRQQAIEALEKYLLRQH